MLTITLFQDLKKIYLFIIITYPLVPDKIHAFNYSR